MSVDKPQLHEESFSFLEDGEIVEVVLEPFLEEVLGGEGHEAEEAFTGDEHEEEMLEIIPGAGEGPEVQPEMEDVNEEPPIIPPMVMVGLPSR